jgi:hypothetical protein
MNEGNFFFFGERHLREKLDGKESPPFLGENKE